MCSVGGEAASRQPSCMHCLAFTAALQVRRKVGMQAGARGVGAGAGEGQSRCGEVGGPHWEQAAAASL